MSARVRAFNGLDVLVARDEGLFPTLDGTLTQPVSVQGKVLDRGEASMFQG
jgi:hypothetical protein